MKKAIEKPRPAHALGGCVATHNVIMAHNVIRAHNVIKIM